MEVKVSSRRSRTITYIPIIRQRIVRHPDLFGISLVIGTTPLCPSLLPRTESCRLQLSPLWVNIGHGKLRPSGRGRAYVCASVTTELHLMFRPAPIAL